MIKMARNGATSDQDNPNDIKAKNRTTTSTIPTNGTISVSDNYVLVTTLVTVIYSCVLTWAAFNESL